MGTTDNQKNAVFREYLRYGFEKKTAEHWLHQEMPQHQVKLSSFYVSQCPITQAQWRSVASLAPVNHALNPIPSRFDGDNRPVEQVSL